MTARSEALFKAMETAPVTPDQASARPADEIYGSHVFTLDMMQRRLPKDVYRKLAKIISEGERLDPDIADVVASAMKDWALEMGATHYTHWFQPMTGLTAEKHDAFISPVGLSLIHI